MSKRLRALALLAPLAASPAQALVGESAQGGPMAPHVAMILTSRAAGAGFCTGVVIAPGAILTAAHCMADSRDMRILVKGETALTFIEPAALAIHPDYRAKAVQTRERSIDLAIIKTDSGLPEGLKPLAFDDRAPQPGDLYGVAGFGVTREGAGKTGGLLRWGALKTRAPLSKILLWAEDPKARGFGACEGDSGGPVFALDTSALVAITNWSAGEGKSHCGKLTQAALIAPQRAWIERVLRGWGLAR